MIVGDSSGGNLALTACMKLKGMGVRLPDALLVAYPSTNVSTSACPSRIISVVDPILPLGVLMACQQVRGQQ
jgi:hormone-sensitive lipase